MGKKRSKDKGGPAAMDVSDGGDRSGGGATTPGEAADAGKLTPLLTSALHPFYVLLGVFRLHILLTSPSRVIGLSAFLSKIAGQCKQVITDSGFSVGDLIEAFCVMTSVHGV